MLTADYARQIAIAANRELNNTLDIILVAAKKGDITVNIPQEILPHESVQSLRDLGYTVIWNSACLWFEVSW